MAFNVSNFTGVISKKGLASSNKFEVSIVTPFGNDQDMNLMCDTVTIAGKNVQSTADIQYGIRREIAYGAPTFDPLTLTFYCTEKLEEKKILDRWQELMVKTVGPNRTGGSFDVGYYDTYAGSSQIEVTKLSTSGEAVFKYQYLEVYPKTVSALELSHGTSSGPMKISAIFNYTYWKDITTS